MVRSATSRVVEDPGRDPGLSSTNDLLLVIYLFFHLCSDPLQGVVKYWSSVVSVRTDPTTFPFPHISQFIKLLIGYFIKQLSSEDT